MVAGLIHISDQFEPELSKKAKSDTPKIWNYHDGPEIETEQEKCQDSANR